MKQPKDLLLEYLASDLPVEEIRTKLASAGDRRSKKMLALLELDETCRQILSPIDCPVEAAENLAQMVSSPEPYCKTAVACDSRALGRVSRLLRFDVVGAQRAPKNAQKDRPKKKSSPLKKRGDG
jgi:hypothetical protein